jgi:hypothetical protein
VEAVPGRFYASSISQLFTPSFDLVGKRRNSGIEGGGGKKLPGMGAVCAPLTHNFQKSEKPYLPVKNGGVTAPTGTVMGMTHAILPISGQSRGLLRVCNGKQLIEDTH